MAHLLVSLLWSRDLLFLLLMENGITNKDLDGGAGFSEGVTASRPSPLTEPLYTNILTTTSSPVHLSPRYTHHSFTLTFPALLRRVHSSSLSLLIYHLPLQSRETWLPPSTLRVLICSTHSLDFTPRRAGWGCIPLTIAGVAPRCCEVTWNCVDTIRKTCFQLCWHRLRAALGSLGSAREAVPLPGLGLAPREAGGRSRLAGVRGNLPSRLGTRSVCGLPLPRSPHGF